MNFCHKLTLSGSMASRRVLSVEDLLACITFAFERKFMKVTSASNVENPQQVKTFRLQIWLAFVELFSLIAYSLAGRQFQRQGHIRNHEGGGSDGEVPSHVVVLGATWRYLLGVNARVEPT
jgi:hypothetical protein